MSEKLKPCPFCGTTEHLFIENREERDPDYKSDHVVCKMCGAVHVKDDCLGWNARPTEKAAREKVLELVDLLINKQIRSYGIFDDASDDAQDKICLLNNISNALIYDYKERFHEQG